MNKLPTTKSITFSYINLIFFNTLAASFIWGVNTLFLLDAGLNNFEAFVANAFFSVGMVLFEVPTGVVADTVGRRCSYLLGCGTLFLTTLLYLVLWQYKSHFYLWCLVSLLLGLGFTFFSGAVEAWLVDALNHVGFKGNLENVFSKGQIANGVAMLTGSVTGGYVAQATNLGAPYVLRILALIISFGLAAFYMKDLGFEPKKLERVGLEMKRILVASIDNGIKVPSVRWAMLTSPFLMGVLFYGFYAAQPYLLELYGNPEAYGIAGLAAALMASSQIVGGLMVPQLRKIFTRRSHIMMLCTFGGVVVLLILGLTTHFWIATAMLGIWALLTAAFMPIKQAYINNCLASDQRATILSFDGLMGSLGGTVFQPILGRSADIYSYGTSYILCSVIQIGALPFIWLAGRTNSTADQMANEN